MGTAQPGLGKLLVQVILVLLAMKYSEEKKKLNNFYDSAYCESINNTHIDKTLYKQPHCYNIKYRLWMT